MAMVIAHAAESRPILHQENKGNEARATLAQGNEMAGAHFATRFKEKRSEAKMIFSA
jgi:hypothetical protein